MSSARPEYSIVVAAAAVLLAIGLPSLGRGQLLAGGLCLVLAGAVAGFGAITYWRSRG